MNNSENLIASWLMDYALFKAWCEFKSYHSVEHTIDRDFVQVVLKLYPQHTPEMFSIAHFLVVMCKLADGEDYQAEYEVPSSITVLEEAIKLLEQLNTNLSENQKQELDDLIRSAKEQAVYVCCRNEDFQKAGEVFKRVWDTVTTEAEKISKGAISRILEKSDSKDTLLIDSSYQGFMYQVVSLFSQIIPIEGQPFLVEAAEDVLKQTRQKDKEKIPYADMKVSGGLSSLVMRKLEVSHRKEKGSPTKRPDPEDPLPTVRTNKATKTNPKLKVKMVPSSATNSSAGSGSETDENGDKADPSSTSTRSQSKGTFSWKQRYNRNKLRENRHTVPEETTNEPQSELTQELVRCPIRKDPTDQQSTKSSRLHDGEESEGSADSPVIPKLRAKLAAISPFRVRESLQPPVSRPESPSSKPSTPNAKARNTKRALYGKDSSSPTKKLKIQGNGKRIPWSREETENVYQGVKRFGLGEWVQIKSHYDFDTRSNVQIKDRWRTITKDPSLMESLRAKFGRVDY